MQAFGLPGVHPDLDECLAFVKEWLHEVDSGNLLTTVSEIQLNFTAFVYCTGIDAGNVQLYSQCVCACNSQERLARRDIISLPYYGACTRGSRRLLCSLRYR